MFDDDLEEMFEGAGDEVDVRFRGQPFTAFLNNEFVAVGSGTVQAEDSHPVLYAPTSMVSMAKRGDEIIVAGSTYEVVGVQPDGTGVTVLVLNDAD